MVYIFWCKFVLQVLDSFTTDQKKRYQKDFIIVMLPALNSIENKYFKWNIIKKNTCFFQSHLLKTILAKWLFHSSKLSCCNILTYLFFNFDYIICLLTINYYYCFYFLLFFELTYFGFFCNLWVDYDVIQTILDRLDGIIYIVCVLWDNSKLEIHRIHNFFLETNMKLKRFFDRM